MLNESEYSKPEMERIPNTKEGLEGLLTRLNEYIESFGPIYSEMEKVTSEDKEYLKQMFDEGVVEDKELPFFQSVFEKLIEHEKTQRNFLEAINLKVKIMEALNKLKDKES
ncbi:hypothetical protein C4544_05580 [candidate division WS5 bacterium]|uniref:Uncharacterized protein n=1 Tax=candidate division WS5 bacterium TaxID=2093353 RepID=A0A419DAW8_9BACT|nr:MAG: hypothetical protein C4544_05580 [candidate division WS5 bacterium]